MSTNEQLYADWHALATTMKVMLERQAIYFKNRQPADLDASKMMEGRATNLINVLWMRRPAATDGPTATCYLSFLNRCIYLIRQQQEYFKTKDRAVLQQCKALEKEMKESIAEVLNPQHQQSMLQPTLF